MDFFVSLPHNFIKQYSYASHVIFRYLSYNPQRMLNDVACNPQIMLYFLSNQQYTTEDALERAADSYGGLTV